MNDVPNAPVPIRLSTRKEIAWRAGVDPRTLRRLEKGEGIGPGTRRKVVDVMDDDTFVDGMDQRFAAALSEVASAYGIGSLLTERFAPSVGAVAVVVVFACSFSLIVDLEKDTAGAIRGLCFGLAILATCIHASIVGRRRRREARRRATPAARVALEGIRVGVIRHLSRRGYECLSRTVGERVVVEAMQVSPRGVSIL